MSAVGSLARATNAPPRPAATVPFAGISSPAARAVSGELASAPAVAAMHIASGTMERGHERAPERIASGLVIARIITARALRLKVPKGVRLRNADRCYGNRANRPEIHEAYD